MKKKEKILIGILLILLVIVGSIYINVKNTNKGSVIQRQETSKGQLTETSGENAYVSTESHLAEVNDQYLQGFVDGQKNATENLEITYTYHKHTGSAGATANGCYTKANYHSHTGSSSSGGGCYTQPKYHSHSGSASSGGGCYTTPNYHVHVTSCNKTCGGPMYAIEYGVQNSEGSWDAKIACDWCGWSAVWDCAAQQQHKGEEFQRYNCQKITGYKCGKSTSTIESYSLGCGKTTSTVDGYNVGCGKTTSTVTGYTLGCGKTTSTIESATIKY